MIPSQFYRNRHLVWSDETLGRYHYSIEERIEKKLSSYLIPGKKVLNYRGQNLHSPDYPDGSIDIALMIRSLNSTPHREDILRELHRILVPGGLLLTSTDCLGEPLSRDAFRQWYCQRPSKAPVLFYDTFRKLRQLTEGSGFHTLESEELCTGMPHLFLASEKVPRDPH